MRLYRIAGLVACVCAVGFAQNAPPRLDPVQWSMTSAAEVAKPGATVPLHLTAKIEPGWHLYSLTIPKDLYPTKLTLVDNSAVDSYTVYQPQPVRAMDPNLKEMVETYSNQAEFWIPATLKNDAAGPVELTAQVRYRACDDKQCLNPRTKTATFKLTAAASAPAIQPFAVPSGYTEVKPGAPPVERVPEKVPAASSQQGIAAFALTAFGFGLAAIFTPCVFPMIPITVSFFLNQRGGIVQALVFSLGIVVLLIVTAAAAFAMLGGFRIPHPATGAAPAAEGSASAPFATLQSAPQDDLRTYRRGKATALEGYRWLDRSGGVVQIPIERAMELVATQGVTSGIKPADRAAPQPGRGQTR